MVVFPFVTLETRKASGFLAFVFSVFTKRTHFGKHVNIRIKA